MIPQIYIEKISQAVSEYFRAEMSKMETAQDQMELISHIIHPNTLALPEFKSVWQQAGVITNLEFDGKLYQASFFDKDNKEIFNEEFQKIAKQILLYLKPQFLSETLELGNRIYPEFKMIWL